MTGPSVSVDLPFRALKTPAWTNAMAKFDVEIDGCEMIIEAGILP